MNECQESKDYRISFDYTSLFLTTPTRILFVFSIILLFHAKSYASTLFENTTVAAGLNNYIADSGDIHGPGAVFTDVNNDSLPDLYLLKGDNAGSLSTPNELYLNDGQGGFYRPDNDAGAADQGSATGAIAADYDNDGDVDLYILNFNGPNVLLQNQLSETGNLAFIDFTNSTNPQDISNNQFGLATATHQSLTYGAMVLDNTLTAAWADVDRDGDLDLFVGNHDSFCLAGDAEGPSGLPGQRDIFYRNNGDGTFSDQTVAFDVNGYETVTGETITSGQHFSSSNAIIFADFDNDRWPDLLVTNKVGGIDDRNMLYRNLGEDAIGTWLGFELISYKMSKAFGYNSGSAMGVDVGDPDNDGDLDIYITEASALGPNAIGRNDYWINQYSETGELSFVYSADMPSAFSWGVQWQDFDLDGRQDLYVASHNSLTDNLYLNTPSGFTEAGESAGIAQNKNSRSAVSADYDRDGWPDVFVVNKSDSSALYRNNSSVQTQHNYLVLALEGDPSLPGPYKSNRSAIGARATIMADLDNNGTIDPEEFQIREVRAGSSSAGSTASLELEFGLGSAQSAQVEIAWPSGRITQIKVPTNQHLQIKEQVESGERITNGDFEDSDKDWTTIVAGGAEAEWQVALDQDLNTIMTVDVDSNNNQPWQVMLQQSNVSLQVNRNYRLTFKARSNIANTGMFLLVGQNYAPFQPTGLNKYIGLDTQWQTYNIDFKSPVNDLNSRLGFLLGFGDSRLVSIDDISLQALPIEYQSSELLINGDFESPNNAFNALALGAASDVSVDFNATSNRQGKAASISMGDGGQQAWEVQFGQQDFDIIAGQKYVLKFGAKASAPGTISSALMQQNSPWANLGHYAQYNVDVNWQSYETTFEATSSEDPSRLAFLLGGEGARTIWFDRISIKPWEAPPETLISPAELLPNGGFEQGLSGWRLETLDPVSNTWSLDPSMSSQGRQSLKATIINSSGIPWHTQLINDGQFIQEGREYRISIDVKSDKAGFAILSVDQDQAPWANLGLRQALPLTTEWQSYVVTFRATGDDFAARLSLQLSAGQTARNVWIDNAGAAASCGATVIASTNLTIVQGQGSGNYQAGDEVPITALPPEEGYFFSHWTSNNGGSFADVNSVSTSFTMPEGVVTLTAHFLPGVAADANVSSARRWNEVLLQAIRNDFARPTVHARNLFHISAAMYDAWSAYGTIETPWLLGKTRAGVNCSVDSFTPQENAQTSRNEAISYMSYRLIQHRFVNSPGAERVALDTEAIMSYYGYDPAVDTIDVSSGSAAALGNYLAQCYIDFGLSDNANEQNDYANLHYQTVNPALEPELPGNPFLSDLNRWQPLKLALSIDQSGNEVSTQPDFLSPEWGQVVPFALRQTDLNVNNRDGFDYWLYHDPSMPPQVDSGTYKWAFSLVSIWSSYLDPSNNQVIDISPASIGNTQLLPAQFDEYVDYYDLNNGFGLNQGYVVNPKTGAPYTPEYVPVGDYTRVLAEYWADGPDSETPPGHWFVILNSVTEHPLLERKWNGAGVELSNLEWDVKSYFVLGGAMHDSAIAAWGAKGWYDYIRPISAIRGMADLGQSSDFLLPSWHPNGISLEPGMIELVGIDDPLAGELGEHINKIKVFAWRGPDYVDDPLTDVAGVGWILAENWWPYQRPSFVTPPFAGYVSGHSTFSRAAAEVMSLITGDEYFPGGLSTLTIPQDNFLVFEKGPSVSFSLQWARYQDAADQSALSRIWGGIHPPIDDIPGRLMGKEIGIDAFDNAQLYLNGAVE
ncbi:carbohydrate binding domain-containing protein [Glaciecola petra]|uniref:Carbohydrate binding domain-containing protein n=1 Tax=Glaciecola petra TaxID=3075602 RepID=A0ABU2ZND6_9ALTE|nr:carbohydrate binding domain-containing protein [Aestuariibacter sp. P117]MDT0593771.1 carbohydrate binding domain-containing protein [Aestuariibacter sp. P117]